MVEWHRFSGPDALAQTLAATIHAALRNAINQRDRAALIVSGGSTPKRLFAALAAAELDWAKVTITLADERWVDEDHPDSNAGLIRAHLLKDRAAAANFVSLKTDAATPEQGQAECAQRLRDAGLDAPADVLVLGMGLDGHTASWFPDAPELPGALASDQLCAAMRPAGQPLPRITLTPAILNAARLRVLHVEGDAKKMLLDQVLAADPQPERWPISAALAGGASPVHVFWAP